MCVCFRVEKVLEVVKPLNDEDVMDHSIMFTKVCIVGKNWRLLAACLAFHALLAKALESPKEVMAS